MSVWWKKKLPLVGSVLFRGNLPPQPEDFSFLQRQGISIVPARNNTRTSWTLKLIHPVWGEAELWVDNTQMLPSRDILKYTLMDDSDREAAATAGSSVLLKMDSKHDHVLRDRKLLLRYLFAVMGNDGVLAIDHLPERMWPRQDLIEELSHDADLDVEGITTLHAVTEDGSEQPYWVHSHGLSEVGGFEFDIFEPSEESMHGLSELCRALSFHILEGNVGPTTPEFPLVYPNGTIRLVEMDHFLRNTDPARRARYSLDANDPHRKNHSALCEPEGGFIGKLFGQKPLQPVRFLSNELPKNPVFSFSSMASQLMAERAKMTYPLLRSFRQEFIEFELPCLVKLGITTDGGGSKEHMWFEVHQLFDDSIDATLANTPHQVSRMREGDRGRHSIDLISDWIILTPFGMINPRSTTVARIIRANPEVMRNQAGQMRRAANR